jgi:hypothetical protein
LYIEAAPAKDEPCRARREAATRRSRLSVNLRVPRGTRYCGARGSRNASGRSSQVTCSSTRTRVILTL